MHLPHTRHRTLLKRAGHRRRCAWRAESDGRFVSKLAATAPAPAPDSAALGGKPAASFYDRTEADGRFVTIAPGTVNAAPNSAQLEGHPASAFPLKGTDVTTTMTLPAGAVAAHSCTTTQLTVTGARVGDVAVLGFVGDVPAPPGLTFQPLKVASPDGMTLRMCNPTATPSPAARLSASGSSRCGDVTAAAATAQRRRASPCSASRQAGSRSTSASA
ncbi:MAG: hypothetical protein QOE11_1831 [Solirubrobacteraceae bacterium]|jgi:hypothetical protein|nr:hypothetical protein [Solirubrobacteraceae bacterium]